jgi:hypothetical protein
VTTVVCRCDGTFRDGLDVGAVFPEATSLRVEWGRRSRGRELTAAEVGIFLSHIYESSPSLVARVKTLNMQLFSMPAANSLAGSVADFLSRCAACHPSPLG